MQIFANKGQQNIENGWKIHAISCAFLAQQILFPQFMFNAAILWQVKGDIQVKKSRWFCYYYYTSFKDIRNSSIIMRSSYLLFIEDISVILNELDLDLPISVVDREIFDNKKSKKLSSFLLRHDFLLRCWIQLMSALQIMLPTIINK